MWSAGAGWMNGLISQKHKYLWFSEKQAKENQFSCYFCSKLTANLGEDCQLPICSWLFPNSLSCKAAVLRFKLCLWFDLSLPENRSRVCIIYNPISALMLMSDRCSINVYWWTSGQNSWRNHITKPETDLSAHRLPTSVGYFYYYRSYHIHTFSRYSNWEAVLTILGWLTLLFLVSLSSIQITFLSKTFPLYFPASP